MGIHSKMTAIADKIRTLLGITGTMGLDAMSENLDAAVNQNNSQAELIYLIKAALVGKGAGDGVSDITLDSITLTPQKTLQEVTSEPGSAFYKVTVNPIPDQYHELPAIAENVLGTASDLAAGKQLIGANGNVVEGNVREYSGSYSNFNTDDLTIEWDDDWAIRNFVPYDILLREGTQVTMWAHRDFFGDATPADVRSGVYFTSKEGLKIPGALEVGVQLPTIAEDVLGTAEDLVQGKQLIRPDGEIVTGAIREAIPSFWVDDEYGVTGQVSGNYVKARWNITDDTIFRKGSSIELWFPVQSIGAEQATPSITVESTTGRITASAEQSAGYVSSGTTSTYEQLATQGAQIITPGTSDKTISSGQYLTGTQTIKGDSNLLPENIKKGISIFNVTGTLETSSGGSGVLVTRTGTTTSPSIDTGLSEIVALSLNKASHTSTGLIHASIIVPIDKVHMGGCSNHQQYMSTYATGVYTMSNYCTIEGGIMTWSSASASSPSSTTFVDGHTYNWYAIGYE